MKNRSNCPKPYCFFLTFLAIIILHGCSFYQRQPIKIEAKRISKKAQKVNQIVVHVADTMFTLSNVIVDGNDISGLAQNYDSTELNFKYYNKLQHKRMAVAPLWNNGFTTQLHLYVNQTDFLPHNRVQINLRDVAHVEWYHNNGLKIATGTTIFKLGSCVTVYNFFLLNFFCWECE